MYYASRCIVSPCLSRFISSMDPASLGAGRSGGLGASTGPQPAKSLSEDLLHVAARRDCSDPTNG